MEIVSVGRKGDLAMRRLGLKVIASFTELNNEGRTVIIVTHDPNVASHAKRIVKMVDGSIEKYGKI